MKIHTYIYIFTNLAVVPEAANVAGATALAGLESRAVQRLSPQF